MMNPTGAVQRQDITGLSYQLSNIDERLIQIIELLHQITELLEKQEVTNGTKRKDSQVVV